MRSQNKFVRIVNLFLTISITLNPISGLFSHTSALEFSNIANTFLENQMDWGNLGDYSELKQTHSQELVQKLKNIELQTELNITSNQNSNQEKLLDISQKLLSTDTDLSSPAETQLVKDKIIKADTDTLALLKQSDIVDTYLEPLTGQESVIDPSLVSKNNIITTKSTENIVELPKNIQQGNIQLGPKNSKNSKPIIGFQPFKTNNRTASIEENKALYENIWENVDALYTTKTNGIKEDLILKNDKSRQINTNSSGYLGNNLWLFYYKLNLTEVTAEIKEDGQIHYFDTHGEEIAYTTSPFMIDNRGEISDQIHFDLITEEEFQKGYQPQFTKTNSIITPNQNDQTISAEPDQSLAATQKTGFIQSIGQEIKNTFNSLFNLFGLSQAQTLSEFDQSNTTSPSQSELDLSPVNQATPTATSQPDTSTPKYAYLVLVANTTNLQYPINIDPTTYILTQSNSYSYENGKLGDNQVNDVKVYDTNLEPTSNYQANQELKSTLAFNNSLQEFDLSVNNLISLWNLEENNGASVQDDATTPATGNLINNPSWTTGKIGSALNFNGLNNYIDFDDQDKLSFNNTDFSLSLWIKPSSLEQDGGILSKGNSGNWEYYLGHNTSGQIIFNAYQSDGNLHFNLTSSKNSLKNGEWQHLVISNKSGQNASLYINKILNKSTSSYSGNMINGNAHLNLGRGQDTASTNYFHGIIDQISLYNTALDQTQINTLYYNNSSKLSGWWNFDNNTYDHSGQNNQINLSTNSFTNEANSGQALTFDGTNILELGNSYSLSPNQRNNSNFSVESWIKTNTSGTITNIISKNDEYGLNICHDGRPVMMININGVWQSTAGTGNSCLDSTAQTINDNSWHHLAGTFDGKFIRLYIDGQQASYYYFPGQISRSANQAILGNNYNGSIDEAAIYQRVLSSDEISVHCDRNYQSSISTVINFDQSISNANYSQLTLDNLLVEQTGILQIKGTDFDNQNISENIKLRSGNISRILSSKRYKSITELNALNTQGNTGNDSLVISQGQLLAFSPYHDANWKNGISKVDDYVTGIWNFDEDSGNTINDSSGSNNTGFLAGKSGNQNWPYQRIIEINPATSVSNYQIKIEFNPKNFDYQNSKSDGSDLRFFNANGVELNYWIENWNTNDKSFVWVKIPNIGTSSITMKYGNFSAISKSNGNNVFEFFDDFTGTTINTSKWTIFDNGGYQTQNNKLIVSGGSGAWGSNGLTSKTNFYRSNNYELNFDYKPTGGSHGMFGWHDSGTGTSYTDLVYAYYNNSGNILIYEDDNNRATPLGSWTNNNTYKIKIPLKSSSGATYQRSINQGNSFETNYNSTYSTETPLKVGIANYNKAYEIDNLYVRNYSSTESLATLGGLILTPENYTGQPDWMDSNWQYRTILHINNQNNNYNLTDFQIPINIDSNLLINSGQMQSDGDDIRITETDNTLPANYWLEEGINSHSTKIWVKIPSINAKSTKDIYLYYGNSGASAISNFDNTFSKNTSENGLISSWHLDEGTGTTTNDNSSNNIPLSLVNGAAWQGTDGGHWDSKTEQKFSTGSHVNLDGTDDYLQVPANPVYNFGTNDWTISTWFKPNAISTCDEIWAQNNPYSLLRISCEDSTRWQIYNNSVAYTGPYHNLTVGNWYFITLTRLNNHFYLYNGNNLVWDFDVSTNPTNLGNAVWRFGGSSWASEYFNAAFDEIKIFNKSLSSAEIKTLFERRQYTLTAPQTSINNLPPTSNLPEWDNNGKYGNALSFDGQNDYVTIPKNETINPDNGFTIGAWVKPMALKGWLYTKPITLSPLTAVDNYQVKIPLTTSNIEYDKLKPDGSDIRFTDSQGNNINYWIQNWDQTGTSNVWVKIPSAGTGKIFMYYGNSNAASATNFSNTFTKSFGESNLVGLWHLDENSGTTTADSSGFGHTATLNNNPAWQSIDGGQWNNRSDTYFTSGSHLYFNGSNQYLTSSDSTDWEFGTGDFSVDFWLKIPSNATSQTIIGNRYSGCADNGWNLEFYSTANRLEWHTCNTVVGNSSSTITLNQWNHIVFTRSSGSSKFYINGTNTNTFNNTYNYNNGSTLNIGKDGLNSTGQLNGYLDEVRIIKGKALSAQEIQTQYERRLYVSPEPTVAVISENPTPPTTNLYQRQINLNPTTPEANYPTKIELTSSNFDYSKTRSDGGDLRFTDSNNNSLPYYVENWNTNGNSVIYVKIPASGTSSIIMYYGDKTLTTQSNCDQVLTFCDNFTDGQFDTSKWSKYRLEENDWNEGVTEPGWFMLKANQDKNHTNFPAILGPNLFGQNYEITTRLKFNSTPSENFQQSGLIIYNSDQQYILGSLGYSSGEKINLSIENDNTLTNYQSDFSIPAVVDFKIVKQNNTHTYYYKNTDSSTWTQHATQPSIEMNAEKIGLTAFADNGATISSYFDFINIKKIYDYNSTAFLGTEQAWSYKRGVNLTQQTNTDNFQIKISLTSSNFNYSHVKSDGSDLRFFDENGQKLSYWIETWNNGANSDIWVKIPESGTNKIYMFYGNNSASSESNGFNVFDYFDDFENSSWTNSNWSSSSGTLFSVNSGMLYHPNTLETTNSQQQYTLNNSSNFTNGIIEAKMQPTSCGNSFGKGLNARYQDDNNLYVAGIEAWTSNQTHIGKRVGGTWTNLDQDSLTCSTSTWYNISWKLDGTSQTLVINNVTSQATDTTFSQGKIGLSVDNRETATGAYWDNFKVRKFSSTGEPTAVLEPEEHWLYKKTINLSPSTPQANYQVKVILNPSNFDYANARDDGGDIRFFDLSGSMLNYWIEKWDKNDTSTIWVKIPTINTSSFTIVYGNPTAESLSNGNNTFDFFDNFDNENLDSDKWNWTREISGAWNEGLSQPDALMIDAPQNSNLWETDNSAPVLLANNTNYPLPSNYELVVETQFNPNQNYQQGGLIVYENDNTHLQAMRGYNNGQKVTFKYESSGTANAYDANQTSNITDLKINKISNHYTLSHKPHNQNNWTQHATEYDATINSQQIGLTAYAANGSDLETYYDNIRLRKYSNNDPIASIGTEEASNNINTDNILKNGNNFSLGANDTKAYSTIGGQTLETNLNTNWNHVVMTYDGNMQKLFINGQLKIAEEYDATFNASNLEDFTLGSNYYGLIDDLVISKQAMSDTQVSDWYNTNQAYTKKQPVEEQLNQNQTTNPTTTGLIGYWKLDETTGTSVMDSSSLSNHGTATGSSIVEGKNNKARNFIADNDYISIADKSDYTLSNNYTVSAWINPDNIATDDRGIMGTYTGSSNGFIFAISSSTSGNPVLNFWSNGTWVGSGPTINMDGTWKHVAYSKINNVGTFYLNGVAQSSVTAYPINDGGTLQIGGGGTSWNSNRFDGKIDETRLYNRALTPTEVYLLAHQFDQRNSTDNYQDSQSQSISISGTQTNNQHQLAIKIINSGSTGTATYKTSIDQGKNWSTATYTTGIGNTILRYDNLNTGIDINFDFGTKYNSGDIFQISSWYTEPRSANRGINRSFPDIANIIATPESIDIIDRSDHSLWIRFTKQFNNSYLGNPNTNIQSIDAAYGHLLAGNNSTSSNIGILDVDFKNDQASYYRTNGLPNQITNNIRRRNTTSTTNTSLPLTTNHNTINDLNAKLLNNELYITAGTPGGLNIIKPQSHQVYYGTRNTDQVKKVSLADNGNLGIIIQNDIQAILTLDNIQNYSSDFNFDNYNEIYRGSTATAWPTQYLLPSSADSGQINDFQIINNTSIADQYSSSSTLIGTDTGSSFINSNTSQFGDDQISKETKGFNKYFTNNYITEYFNGDNLIKGLWLEGDQTGPTVSDHSGHNHNLTVHGFGGNGNLLAEDWTSGVRGPSLTFDGVDDYLSVNDHSDFGFDHDNTISFGGWVKPNSTVNQAIIGQTDDTGNNTNFALNIIPGNTGYLKFTANLGTNNELVTATSKEYTANNWHYLTAVADGQNNILNLYIDGSLESDATFTANINHPSLPLTIGSNGNPDQYFSGNLNGLFLSNNALDSNQINSLYRIGLGALQDNSDELNNIGGNSNNIRAVAFDPINKKSYFGTNDGLSEIDLNKDSRTNLWQNNLPSTNVTNLSFGSDGLLVGTPLGAISITTDGTYTNSMAFGMLQSSKANDVYTDGANNYYVSDKGLDVIRLSDQTSLGSAAHEDGFNSVTALGGKVYMGDDQGIWRINTSSLTAEYDLTQPYYTTHSYPPLPSNQIFDVHARTIAGKNYLVAGTANGSILIGDLLGSTFYTVFRNNDNDRITKVWLNEDGDLAYYNATDQQVCVYTNAINNELYTYQTGSSSYTRRYNHTSTPATIGYQVNDLVYTANTSTAQSGQNTLYVATSNGTSVIQEHSTMASGTVKHYTNKLIHDERTGLLIPFRNYSLIPEALANGTGNSISDYDSYKNNLIDGKNKSLIGFWDFDQTIPAGVADRSSHNHHGYFGPDTTLTTGKIGSALYLNGQNNYLDLGDSSSLHTNSDFTLSGWIWKDEALSNKNENDPIIASKYDSGANGEFVLYYNKNNKLQLKVSDGSNIAVSGESSTISPYTWHHITATYHQGLIRFYIDGQLDFTQQLSVTSLATPPYNSNPNLSSTLYLGNDWQITKSGFGGYIDEFAYFDQSLTYEEIQTLYTTNAISNTGITTNPQSSLTYPASAQVITNSGAQETMHLTFDETLSGTHSENPSKAIETSWQKPSLNLITYNSSTANNIVLDKGNTGNWDESFVSSPKIIKDGNLYKMWYTGSDSSNKYRIGYATSTDSLSWTKYPVNNCTSTTGDGCVLDVSAGKFDSNYAYSADVIKDNNLYKMWYTGYDGSTYNIGYATSLDGINWIKQNSGNPVLTAGSSGAWDDLFVGYPTILKEGTAYKMWYSGEQSDFLFRLGYATSNDGVNWTKYDDTTNATCGFSESNDHGCLVNLGASGKFDEMDLEEPNIFKLNSLYYLSYFGHNTSSTGQIGLLTSTNGLDWTRANDGNPVLIPSTGWDSSHMTSHSTIYDSNELKIYYTGSDGTNARIGLASMQFGPGRYGKSLYLGNNDQYIYQINNKLNQRSGTISLWTRLDNVSDNQHEIFNLFDNNSGAQDGLYIAIKNNDLQVGYNGQINSLGVAPNVTNNYWNNIVLTWEKPSATNENFKLYYNGTLLGSTTFNSALSTIYDSLQLGGNPTETRDYLKGYLDDFRIYNKALTASEITTLYNGSLGNSSKINYDQDSNTSTPNPLSEGTIEFLYTPDWNSTSDQSSRTLFDSLGGDTTKFSSQYQLNQTSNNRFRIWKDKGDQTNSNDRLHFGILDSSGNLYETYTNKTVNFVSGTTYKIAATWDLDNNDLTSSGNNQLRLLLNGNLVAGDNYTTGITANKKKNGADTNNTEPIIVTAIPEKIQIGSGLPNSQLNLLNNPSFEEGDSTIPANWNITGSIYNYSKNSSQSRYGTDAIAVTGPDTTNKLSQTTINLPVGTYTLSWWSKGLTATDTQNLTINYNSGTQTTSSDPGTNYLYHTSTFTTTIPGPVTINLSAISGETIWYDALTLVKGRLDENYQTSSSTYQDFKITNYQMTLDELNAEYLAQTYNSTNKNASLAGETNNTTSLAVKKINASPTASDDILFVGTKGYASEGALTQITFGTTDQRTNEYRQNTSGTSITSNRINSISYSSVRNNLAVATADAGLFGYLEPTPAVITLTSPTGTEEWEGGSSQNINWITDGACDHVDLYYSTNSGSEYDQTIVTNLADAGTYNWNPIDSINSSTTKLKIFCRDVAGNELASDETPSDFIIDSTKPTAFLYALSNPTGDNIIYGHGTAADSGGATHIEKVQYKLDEADWADAIITSGLGTTDIEYDFSTANVNSGEHTIYVRAKDSSLPNGNESDQTITASRSFNVDSLSISFSKTAFESTLDIINQPVFTDSTTLTVSGYGTAYNIGIKADNPPQHSVYTTENIPFYTGNDLWTSNAKGFGWRYSLYNNGFYNTFPTSSYETFYGGKANTNGVNAKIDFKAVTDWTVDAGTYNNSVSIIVTPRY